MMKRILGITLMAAVVMSAGVVSAALTATNLSFEVGGNIPIPGWTFTNLGSDPMDVGDFRTAGDPDNWYPDTTAGNRVILLEGDNGNEYGRLAQQLTGTVDAGTYTFTLTDVGVANFGDNANAQLKYGFSLDGTNFVSSTTLTEGAEIGSPDNAAGAYTGSETYVATGAESALYLMIETTGAHTGRSVPTIGSTSLEHAPPTGEVNINSFTASETVVESSDTVTLTWSTVDATGATLDQGIGAVATSGSTNVVITADITYELIATNGSSSATGTVSITIAPLEIVSFTADDTVVASNDTVTLSWDVLSEDTLTLEPGSVDVTGLASTNVTVTADTTYSLIASAGGVSVTNTVAVALEGTVVDVDFEDLSIGTTVTNSQRIQDVSGNGYHGFFNGADKDIVAAPNGAGLNNGTVGGTKGIVILQPGLSDIPAGWDGDTNSVSPYFQLDGSANGGFTVEAVVRWDNTDSTSGLFGQTGGNQIWMRNNGNNLQYAIGAGDAVSHFGSDISVTNEVADGQFHAVALVYDGPAGEVRTYVDGVLRHTNTDGDIGNLPSTMLSGTGDFRLGSYNGSAGWEHDGTMDRFRISNYAVATNDLLTAEYPEGAVAISSFTASDTTVESGDAVMLTWGTTNATTVTLDQGIGAVAASGSTNVTILGDITYTLIAANGGGSVTDTVSIVIAPLEIVSFTTDGNAVESGGTATLSWDVLSEDTLTLEPGSIDVTGLDSTGVTVTGDTTYSLIASAGGVSLTNTLGLVLQSVVVDVDFEDLSIGTTVTNGQRIQDVSGNGYHGFFNGTDKDIVAAPNGAGLDNGTVGGAKGIVILQPGLTDIPAGWDGDTNSVSPYFQLDGSAGGGWTMEAVVRWDNTDTASGLFGQTGGNQIWMRENGGNLQYAIGAGDAVSHFGSDINVAAEKADGDFHAIALVYDGPAGEVRTYVDGVLKHTNPDADVGNLPSAMLSGTGDFHLGAYKNDSAWFHDGAMDQFRVSNYAVAPGNLLVGGSVGSDPIGSIGVGTVLPGGGLTLSWGPTTIGQTYNVETNADLTVSAGWGIFDTIVGDGGGITVTGTTAEVELFYKVTSP